MIITSQNADSGKGKKDIIIDQLDQLGLKEGSDYIVYVEPKDEETNLCEVLISIKIQQEILDQTATEIGLEATLTNPFCTHFVKTKFDIKFKKFFNSFDATERQEAIYEFLSKEIDFDYFESAGIIEAHYPLHLKYTLFEIQESMSKYRFRLLKSFLWGDFVKHFQPINQMKNYYGEKYAFEFAYLLHYQAWLSIPSVVGLMLFFYQINRYRTVP